MKKVFFIINSFSKGGGAEALLTMIVNNLNPQKYEIGIMEVVHDEIKVEPTNDNIKIYPYYVKANDPNRNAKMYYVYHEWDKVIDEYVPKDYDLYVSFNYLKPSFLLPRGKKNIAWIHTDVYDLLAEDKKEEKELQNDAFKKAQKIVVISDITKQSIEEMYPEHSDKIRLIWNGIDEKQIKEKAKEQTDVKLEHPAILAIGRLEDRKNPLRLLSVFEQVHKKRKDTHLYYLGYGELEEEVRRRSQEMGINEYVHLLGYYDNPFPIIAQCDVSCMLSKADGFGLVMAESICLGRPYVATDIGAARFLSNDGKCGRVIETDDQAAEEILSLLNYDENMELYCSEAIKRCELNHYIRQIEDLFDEVINS